MQKSLFFALALAIAMLGTGCNAHRNEPASKQKTYKYDFFDEPCLNWGAGQGTIKQWMMERNYSLQKTAKQDSYDMIYYKPKKSEMSTVLAFDPMFGYEMAIVYVLTSEVSYQEMLSYLSERYDYSSVGLTYFVTDDGKTLIQLTTITSGGVSAHAVIYSEFK